jgi:predicted metal-dependent hydrolase
VRSITRASKSSSRTSSASAGSSRKSTQRRPDPAGDPAERSRARKAERGPKREPAGSATEPARSRCDDPPPPELLKGIEQLNAGEFFEQHETLELLWRDTAVSVRGLYHGILQIGVGLYHWSRGNFHGATVLLAEGIDRLAPFTPECQRVDVAKLVRDASALREELIRLGPERMADRQLPGALQVSVRGPGSRG